MPMPARRITQAVLLVLSLALPFTASALADSTSGKIIVIYVSAWN